MDTEKQDKEAAEEYVKRTWPHGSRSYSSALNYSRADFLAGIAHGRAQSDEKLKAMALEITALEFRLIEERKAWEGRFGKDFFLEVIQEWRFFWMNQKQNSKADFDHYFRRALGVDANMQHDLAVRLSTAASGDARHSETDPATGKEP